MFLSSSLYHTMMPPESLPRLMWGFFREGTISSLYPLGQCVDTSARLHVSWRIITSMLFILFTKSGSVLFIPKVEEHRPWIFQLLILNDAVFINKNLWFMVVKEIRSD